MPMPAGPVPHFILIQAALAFGGSKTFVHRPALPRHRDHLFEPRLGRSKDPIIGPFLWVVHAAAHQQPARPALEHTVRLDRRPVVPTRALAALARAPPPPHIGGKLS